MTTATFLLIPLCVQITVSAQGVVGINPGISFATLTGTNLAPYTGDLEGDFAVTPTTGTWLQATYYGSPTPSILLGPVNAPGIGAIQITDRFGRFTLAGLDYSSNNGDSIYDIQGFLGATMVYDETGTLSGTFGPFSFSTLLTANPLVPVDGLIVEVIPGSSVTSVNLDNIQVATVPVVVPEPGAAMYLGLGFIGLMSRRLLR